MQTSVEIWQGCLTSTRGVLVVGDENKSYWNCLDYEWFLITIPLHTTATSFDIKPSDMYACVADAGWITGHTYIVYGPLMNGCSSTVGKPINLEVCQ